MPQHIYTAQLRKSFGKAQLLVWATVLTLLMTLNACQNHDVVFQDQYIISEGQWSQDSAKVFTFNIDDITARYNIYYFVRNNLDYPYANIYLKEEITGPNNSKPEAQLNQFFLANPETGQPLGSGLAEVRDNTLLAHQAAQFKQVGQYKLSLKQYMRQATLPGVTCVGVFVQKVGQEQ